MTRGPVDERHVESVDPVDPDARDPNYAAVEPVVQTVRPWRRWQNWGNVLAGAWLFISPWVLNFANGAGTYGTYRGATTAGANACGTAGTAAAGCNADPWNAWVVGVLIFLVALWALAAPMFSWPEWINMALGVWLFISPWVLGFAGNNGANNGPNYNNFRPAESWNAWIVGVAVFILALWALIKVRQANANGPSGIVGFLVRRPRRPVNP